VREIGLLSSLTAEEADAFLDVFVKALSRTDGPPEIANMLWELGSKSIHYRTIDHVVDGEAFAPPEPGDYEQTAHLFFSTVEIDEPEVIDSGKVKEQNPHGYQGVQKTRYLQVRDIFHGAIKLSPTDASRLREILDLDDKSDCLAEAFRVYDEILHGEYAPQMAAEVVRVTSCQFEMLLEQDNWSLLPRVLNNTRSWLKKFAEEPNIASPMRDILYHAGDKQVLGQLAQCLNDHPQANLAPFNEYLRQLDAISLGAVTAMLGDLEHHSARKMVYGYLSERAEQAIDLVGNYVYDERWYVVRNVVLVLGQVNQPRAMTFLKKAIRHTDPRVRREVIRSLGTRRYEETDSLLLPLLNDPDPNLQIHACRALAAAPSITVFEALRKKIDESELARLEPRMQRELLAAFARAGGDRALTRLSSMIKKRKLFGKSRRQQIKINAVYAVGEIDSPSAAGFLRELAQAPDESLSAVARQVLEKSERNDTAEIAAL
jgi:HEAT repeat protein